MKTAGLVILGIFAAIGIFVAMSILTLAVIGILAAGTMDPQGVQRKASEAVENAAHENQGTPAPEKAAEPAQQPTDTPEPQQDSRADWVAADAQAYYDAATGGNFEYTHEQLVQFDRTVFTLSDWTLANEQLGTAGTPFEVTDVAMVSPTVADVTVLVNGDPRYTRFELEGGSFKHSLTQEEYTMFFEATLGAATASASAAAS